MAELVLRPIVKPDAMSDLEAGYPAATAVMFQVSGMNDLGYRFPYAPVEVQFGKLSALYEEVERPGRTALISLKAEQLMHASFKFRIAHRPSNGLQSIERDIEILRRMSSENKSVALVGLGSFFSGSQRVVINGTPTVSRTLFRIMDMSLKIIRRGGDNEPWQADCDIELIEDRNPNFVAVTFSAITYDEVVPVSVTSTKSSGNKPKGGGSNNTPAPPAPLTPYSSIGKGGSAGGRIVTAI